DKNIYVCGEINPNAGIYFKFNVVKYNPNGNYEWNYLYDINASSIASGMYVNKSGSLYASGIGKNPNGNLDFMTVKFSSLTAVEETDISSPNTFHLYQNYPNPFNPYTKIRYSIPDVIASPNGTKQSANVTLKVYDVLGNEVATLVDEFKSAGNYEVKFDATNLSSGTYFYRITAGEFSETKKLILIK
ncbi:MAG: T9SS type A sorting domain-containing protein, partial [Ignavibacterium sp.]